MYIKIIGEQRFWNGRDSFGGVNRNTRVRSELRNAWCAANDARDDEVRTVVGQRQRIGVSASDDEQAVGNEIDRSRAGQHRPVFKFFKSEWLPRSVCAHGESSLIN